MLEVALVDWWACFALAGIVGTIAVIVSVR